MRNVGFFRSFDETDNFSSVAGFRDDENVALRVLDEAHDSIGGSLVNLLHLLEKRVMEKPGEAQQARFQV